MLYVGFTETARALFWNPVLYFYFEIVSKTLCFLVQFELNPMRWLQ